jgi:hypothetical protein
MSLRGCSLRNSGDELPKPKRLGFFPHFKCGKNRREMSMSIHMTGMYNMIVKRTAFEARGAGTGTAF